MKELNKRYRFVLKMVNDIPYEESGMLDRNSGHFVRITKIWKDNTYSVISDLMDQFIAYDAELIEAEECKYNIVIPQIGVCCRAYYESESKDGRKWMHFPLCNEETCPLKHPELLGGAKLDK